MGRIITPARTPSVHHKLTGEQVCCPQCRHRQIYFRKKQENWLCRTCRAVFTKPTKLVIIDGEVIG